ncbi:MAG: ATP-binding protein [Synechococcaceae cyanobacterium SM1_2_3]|nr:ATP-binding protein [Synechococcaceae cyanobacterium SM1_2_3]
MANADLLIGLIKAGASSDATLFRRHVEALIADERSKKHNILADRLVSILQNAPNNVSQARRTLGENGAHSFVLEQTPERPLDMLVLAPETEALCRELITEQHRSDLLKAYGLSPRHKLLVAGPPGNGKTTLAESIAYELAVPLLVVRYENLIGSFLGETGSRLQKVFDYARTQHCVLFFDEFEILGKERGDNRETGEIKRVVGTLLTQIDRLPDYVVTIAASNHPELLDRAAWRRFQLRITLPAPTRNQIARFVESFAEKRRFQFNLASGTIAEKLSGHSFAEVEEFCVDVFRQAILSGKTDHPRELTQLKLRQWQNRAIVKTNSEVNE